MKKKYALGIEMKKLIFILLLLQIVISGCIQQKPSESKTDSISKEYAERTTEIFIKGIYAGHGATYSGQPSYKEGEKWIVPVNLFTLNARGDIDEMFNLLVYIDAKSGEIEHIRILATEQIVTRDEFIKLTEDIN